MWIVRLGPHLPDWAKELVYPGLQGTGPETYAMDALDQWLHPDQKKGRVTGHQILEELQANDNAILKTCLDLEDLEAIQEKGIKAFQKVFKGKAVFAWKFFIRDCYGNTYVPYLFEFIGEVVLAWNWLSFSWDSNYPALRLA